MIPVTVAQVTAQFLELSACPITSHINGHTNQTSPIGIHTASTISQHLQQLPPILHNTIGHCHFPLDTSDLVEEFNSETLVLASDGSVLMDVMGHAESSKNCAVTQDTFTGIIWDGLENMI